VLAARRAFDEGPWPRMGFAERGALLHRFADLIEANADALALADTTDMGKPISDARGRGWASPSAVRCCTGSPT